MAKPKRTARQEIERAFHVSFKLPEQAAELLDNYRDEVVAQRGKDIAFRIRAELVCCDIYDRVNVRHELTLPQVENQHTGHLLCYWGEGAAQIAKGHCPGYETVPNICQCGCAGCQKTCDEHQEKP